MLENLIRCGAFDSLGINRASLLASMDKILDFSKRLSIDKNDDQLSLFDFGFNVKDTIPTIEIEELREFPVKELLDMEKETLGFYVSGHPFDVYEPYVNRKICLLYTSKIQPV